jgi:hypothetical protein
MELHKIDATIAFISGMFGGFLKYMSGTLMNVGFIWRLAEAGATAFVCGLLGVAGKHFYDWLKKKYFKK